MSLRCSDEFQKSSETLRGLGSFYQTPIALLEQPDNICDQAVVEIFNYDFETNSNANEWHAEVGFWDKSQWSEDPAYWFCGVQLDNSTFQKLKKAVDSDAIGRVSLILEIMFIVDVVAHDMLERQHVTHYVPAKLDNYSAAKSVGKIKSISLISDRNRIFSY